MTAIMDKLKDMINHPIVPSLDKEGKAISMINQYSSVRGGFVNKNVILSIRETNVKNLKQMIWNIQSLEIFRSSDESEFLNMTITLVGLRK